MSSSENDFITHRAQIVAEIARQRGELAQAYRQLEKPIRYTEYGMKGFGFIRQNPWIMTAAPALLGSLPSIFSLVSSAFGWRKKKKAAPVQRQVSPEVAVPTTGKKLSRAGQAVMTGV